MKYDVVETKRSFFISAFLLLLIISLFLKPVACFSSLMKETEKEKILIDLEKQFGKGYSIQDISISPKKDIMAFSLRKHIYLLNIESNKLEKLEIPTCSKRRKLKFSYSGRYLGIHEVDNSGFYDMKTRKYHSYSFLDFGWSYPYYICFSNNDRYFLLIGRLYRTGDVTVAVHLKDYKVSLIEFGDIDVSDVFVTDKEINNNVYKGSTIQRIDAIMNKRKSLYTEKNPVVDVSLTSNNMVSKFGINKINNATDFYFIDGDKKIVCIDDNRILIITSDLKKEIARFKLDNKNYYFCRYIKKANLKNIFVIKSHIRKNRKDSFLHVFDGNTLKQIIPPVKTDRERLVKFNYAIVPSGKFIVYVRDGKLHKKELPEMDKL